MTIPSMPPIPPAQLASARMGLESLATARKALSTFATQYDGTPDAATSGQLRAADSAMEGALDGLRAAGADRHARNLFDGFTNDAIQVGVGANSIDAGNAAWAARQLGYLKVASPKFLGRIDVASSYLNHFISGK